MTRLVLIVAALLLAGCQNARYESKSELSRFGFSSQGISDRRFSVMFEASPDSGLPQAKDYALLRAAELTREAGATDFKVIADRSRVKRRPVPSLGNGRRHFDQLHSVDGNLLPINRVEYFPVAWFEIEIYTDAHPAGPDRTGVLNAAEIQENLAKKYRLTLESRIEDVRS